MSKVRQTPRIEPLSAACGAIVHGVDLSEVDEASLKLIREALHEHLVLFFRDQALDPQSHAAFARRFGPLALHPSGESQLSPDLPEVFLMHSERGGRADVWHTDLTYTESPPIAVVVRYMGGPEKGGDTLWSNMYLAYETLSEPLRELLEGLTALHLSTLDDSLRAEYPAVRVHPETGRRSLYVNRLFTRSLRQLLPTESRLLLDYLHGWSERPELTCRWSWKPGDVAMWDNRCTQHYAVNDYAGERTLHRCMILGDPPVGSAPRWGLPADRKAASSVRYDRREGEPLP